MTVESGAATTAAPALDQPAPDTPDQAGEFVQLLTPEGERIDHPDYPLDLSADDIRSMYRDLVLVRTIDTVAISLQRQGELGIWASLLGQEAAQIGSGRALSPDDMVFPTYREHGVAWCRGIDPVKLLELYRGVSHGGWAPEEHKFHLYTIVIGAQTLHATGYAMGIQRDGDGSARRRGRHRVLRRRRHQPGRRQRGLRLGLGVQRAHRLLLPEQPVGDLRAAGEAEPRPALPAGPRVRLPRAPGRRQRRAGLLRGDAEGLAGGQGRPGPHPDRGVHLPHGRAHHHRRPDQVPAGQRAGDVEAQGPDRARPGLPGPRRPGRAGVLRRGGRGGQAGRRPGPRGLPEHARSAAAGPVRPRVRRAHRDPARGARAVRGLPGLVRGGPTDDQAHLVPRAQRGTAQGARERPQGPDHGRGRRQAGRGLPRHRRPAEGLRRGPGDRHPAGRVRHRRHRDRPGPARLPAGLRDPVRRVRLSRRSTRSSASSPRCATGPAGRSACRW